MLTPDAEITGIRGSLWPLVPGFLPLPGDLLTAHVHPEDGDKLISTLASLAEGSSPATETFLRLCLAETCWTVLARLNRAGPGEIAVSVASVEQHPPNREQLATILDHCENAILVHRGQYPLFANHVFAALSGCSSAADVLRGHRLWANLHPEDRPSVLSRMAAQPGNEDAARRYEFRTLQTGAVRWIECLESQIDWAGGRASLSVYRDVTTRKTAEEARHRAEHLYESVFANCPDPLLLSVFGEGRIVDANDAFLRIRGVQREDLAGVTGLSVGIWLSPETMGRLRALLLDQGRVVNEPLKLTAPNSEELDLLLSSELVHLNGEKLVLSRITDVTERRRAEARIAHLAQHDPLTGIANRVLFQERLDEAFAKGRKFALLSIDLDRFKEVNESFGHAFGDKLLQRVAARLVGAVTERDTVARLGGDEFAIIHQSGRQPGAARALASSVLQRFDEPIEIEGRSILVGASIGLAIAPRDARQSSKLLQAADLSLARGKKSARGSAVEFRPEIGREEEARISLEAELRTALSREQFDLHFQPVVDLRERRAAGCEALLRWHHPERGLVRPDEFISLAEESGLIVPLGRWVLHRACAEAARWPNACKVAVNVSPAQLRRRGLIDDVAAALRTSGLPPAQLELEVTESVVLQDTEEALATLRQLKKMGVSLALDDFGTGYSSMAALVQFPFDRVKIDRSFISGLGKRSECTAVVRAVRGLCVSLGLATTAEGVETEEQARWLLAEGLVEAQGFLFSPARPASDIRAMLDPALQD